MQWVNLVCGFSLPPLAKAARRRKPGHWQTRRDAASWGIGKRGATPQAGALAKAAQRRKLGAVN
jgi:hypothetical protein